jgi:hypothetical protein
MSNIVITQGESKFLPFLIKSKRTGRPLLLTDAIFLLQIKQNEEDLVPVISKSDASFSKTYADTGRIQVFLSITDTNQIAPGTYYGELRIQTASTPSMIYKVKFKMEIEPTGIPDGLIDEGVSIIVADQLTIS